MLYREMGNTGEKVSILGFGCMRFPTQGRYDRIDYEKTVSLLDFALEKGLNYLDTAYPYHGISNSQGGESEVFLGEYLSQNSRREEVYVATKMPTWLLEDSEDLDYFLDKQLKRLQTDQIDFYLLHSLKEKHWDDLEGMGILEFLDSALEDGRINYTGFSTHDETAFFKKVADAYKWDICLIQNNYLDEEIQAGQEGLQYAAGKGMGVTVMEPLKGGVLAKNVPSDVQMLWEESPVPRKPAEWALRYLWDKPEISVVLSGMNSMQQLVENLITAEEGEPHSLSLEEKDIMEKVKQAFQKNIAVQCSACGYCTPCPTGVNIPQCFSYLNQAAMLNDISNVQAQYYFMLNDTERAGKCIECGLCEEACTQNLSIRELLKEVKKTFGQ